MVCLLSFAGLSVKAQSTTTELADKAVKVCVDNSMQERSTFDKVVANIVPVVKAEQIRVAKRDCEIDRMESGDRNFTKKTVKKALQLQK